MRILVAGGGGYIGSALIPKLLERGYDVDVVDLFWFGNHLPAEVRIVHRDLFDLEVADLKEYEQVIFLAGLSNDPMAEFTHVRVRLTATRKMSYSTTSVQSVRLILTASPSCRASAQSCNWWTTIFL